MLKFRVDDLMKDIGKAVVDSELGVEKAGEYLVHESLAETYRQKVVGAVDGLLRERLGLVQADPKGTAPGSG
jgi:hypothetical protein